MANTNDQGPETSTEPRRDAREGVPAEVKEGSAAAPADRAAHSDQRAALATSPPASTRPDSSRARPPSHPLRKGLLWAVAVVGLAFGGYRLVPVVKTMLNTISTDDAYVNGHVTFVAPRIAGQVSRVLVDDN
jgi:membrane fusion protein, multidrug efflux system